MVQQCERSQKMSTVLSVDTNGIFLFSVAGDCLNHISYYLSIIYYRFIIGTTKYRFRYDKQYIYYYY